MLPLLVYQRIRKDQTFVCLKVINYCKDMKVQKCRNVLEK